MLSVRISPTDACTVELMCTVGDEEQLLQASTFSGADPIRAAKILVGRIADGIQMVRDATDNDPRSAADRLSVYLGTIVLEKDELMYVMVGETEFALTDLVSSLYGANEQIKDLRLLPEAARMAYLTMVFGCPIMIDASTVLVNISDTDEPNWVRTEILAKEAAEVSNAVTELKHVLEPLAWNRQDGVGFVAGEQVSVAFVDVAPLLDKGEKVARAFGIDYSGDEPVIRLGDGGTLSLAEAAKRLVSAEEEPVSTNVVSDAGTDDGSAE